ncbi:hypothetical protein Sya03_25560 [Spirilliplanes yamanashiensis]|uniref:Uncharacterized protein n=1 Tax=Spirilliplanes yamanashiensis TaxID=42233 RepID=A0A8J3Y8D3_9ACTN|nr:hypothetical protein Sya03_25560 [Spirilliplanes yamanashiensis]
MPARLPSCAPRRPLGPPGRDSPPVCAVIVRHDGKPPIMHRYVAPLGFTIAAAWVVVLFVLAAKP